MQEIYKFENNIKYEKNIKKYKIKFHLQLCIGSRISITKNIDSSLGLFNGTTGTIVGFYYLDNQQQYLSNTLIFSQGIININEISYHDIKPQNFQIPILLIEIDKHWYNNESFSVIKNNIITLQPIIETFQINNIRFKRIQLPIIPASCITIHRCQGKFYFYFYFL